MASGNVRGGGTLMVEIARENQRGAPNTIQLFPAGPDISTNDGRSFRLSDPAGFVSRFNATNRLVLVDYDHLSHFSPDNGGNSRAAGWISKLTEISGQIWAFVEWTEDAAASIEAREYRFISPEFTVDNTTGEVADLIAASLLNRPAFQMAALTAARTTSPVIPTQRQVPSKEIAMLITSTNLANIFTGFSTAFSSAFDATPSNKDEIAMTTNSQTLEEVYAWLGQFPAIREWIGDRIIKSVSAQGFTIVNKLFESSVTVKATQIEDDQYGVFTPMISEMGRTAKLHPDTLCFELLNAGFTSKCYDGQNFFDTDHPGYDKAGTDVQVSISNMQAGNEPAWFLLDAARYIKPIIWQQRTPYKFQQLTDDKNERVVMRDEYFYGLRARANCGFGLWQLAFGSKAPLTPENYAAARKAMATLRGDQGQLLGIKPTHLVVSTELETEAMTLINADTIAGSSNIWKGSAKLIVTPYLG
jgi:phage major head subunit gpT-like protein